MKKQTIGLVILAAGASERMGTPKQLLEFGGESFLRRSARTALASQGGAVAVVLGAGPPEIADELTGLPVEIVQNPAWREGMSSSIRAGLNRLLELDARLPAVILMVCDQPFVTVGVLDSLIEKYLETDAPIVTSEYAATRGVPALFDRTFFPRLLDLREAGGARQLIRTYPDKTAAVSFPAGGTDIDTPEDYEKVKGKR